MRVLESLKNNWFAYLILIIGVVIMVFPLYMAFIASTHDAATIGRGIMPLTPGKYTVENYIRAWRVGSGANIIGVPVRIMLINSLIMALIIAIGKILVSLLSGYAFVYFDFPLRKFFFWLTFITIMLPLEVRIIPTYKVASDLKLLNSFAGLTLPLMVSATGTLLFRQTFLSIPREFLDAARIDGAGPVRCLTHIVFPLIRPNLSALFVILFIYGWNQYLWPILITTDVKMQTLVMGIVKMLGGPEALVDWNIVMASAIISMIIPVGIVILMQRWLIKGLTEVEK
ncbi:MAG: glycerol-3-phosphate transporter [Dictyoglomus sp. NZ13-RE01]|nr:MAG: glycerol-3-phosphate transporter [Dictyoglomus sp. NZ13-RE01]